MILLNEMSSQVMFHRQVSRGRGEGGEARGEEERRREEGGTDRLCVSGWTELNNQCMVRQTLGSHAPRGDKDLLLAALRLDPLSFGRASEELRAEIVTIRT